MKNYCGLFCLVVLACLAGHLEATFAGVCGQGGPDEFGYYWIDNDSAGGPEYRWIDITTEPGAVEVTSLLGDDNNCGPFAIGFDFPYYWYTVDEVIIGSNGYISFTDRDNYAHPFSNLPSEARPNNLVCPLAGDIDFSRGDPECWYWSNDQDTFVVSWINVPEFYPDPSWADSTHTFQLILTRPDSNLYFMYGEQHGHFEAGNGSYVIGMEDQSGRVGLQYCRSGTPPENVFHDSLAIRWYVESGWPPFLDVGIENVMNEGSFAEVVFVGDTVTLKCEVKNNGRDPVGPFDVRGIVRSPEGTEIFRDTIEICLDPQQSVWLDFSPDIPIDTIGEYALECRTYLEGDMVPGNNRKVVEIRSVEFGGVGTQTLLLWDDTTLETCRGWAGDYGGWANEFEAPESFKIKEVYVPIRGATGGSDGNLIVQIVEQDEFGYPGNVVAEKTVFIPWNQYFQWKVVDLREENIVVQPGFKIWAVGIHENQGTFYFCCDETYSSPRSNRGFEFTGFLQPDRYRETSDVAIRILVEWLAPVTMSCEALTPIFCRGKNFYFGVTLNNSTGSNVSGRLHFGAYAGYNCDPANNLVTIPKNKTYPPGVTIDYYFFKAPDVAAPGQYSASVGGTLNPGSFEVFCCMNTDIVQCGPWKSGGNTEWQLIEVDREESESPLPTITSLSQNYPNPFNATTVINYQLAASNHVRLEVYNLIGERVASLVDEEQEAGYQSVIWNAPEVSSGIYFYKLTSGDYTETKQMMLVK